MSIGRMDNEEGYSWVRVNCKIDPAASKPKGSILLIAGMLGMVSQFTISRCSKYGGQDWDLTSDTREEGFVSRLVQVWLLRLGMPSG